MDDSSIDSCTFLLKINGNCKGLTFMGIAGLQFMQGYSRSSNSFLCKL